MSSFSIDLAADRIVEPRTRIYFEEVAQSYANKCYRSCIVMLWTVVVCDLVYKLQTLRDLYEDESAEKLLEEVEAKQIANPNSPDWELFLLDEVATRTKLLEGSDHIQLQNLQKLRHLSAHPVLTTADLLFQPTKEVARAQIRLALEALLLKPALFSKRIIKTLVEDIAANKASLVSQTKLKAYLEARYLPNIPLAIELELFRALWKFCFRLNNADTQINREINVETLEILYNRNSAAIRTLIDDDSPTFSLIGPDSEPVDALIGFLAKNGDLYQSLNADAHVIIDGRVEAEINNRAKAYFKGDDMTTHLETLDAMDANDLAGMTDEVWLELFTDAEKEGCLESALRLASKIYVNSASYDAADRSFARFIEPVLPKFTAATMEELLAGVDINSQAYGRGRASLDHPHIKDIADQLTVDIQPYRNFASSF